MLKSHGVSATTPKKEKSDAATGPDATPISGKRSAADLAGDEGTPTPSPRKKRAPKTTPKSTPKKVKLEEIEAADDEKATM